MTIRSSIANVTSSDLNSTTGLGVASDYKTGLPQDLAQSDYNFSYLTFPNDVGMDDVGHYMVININVPTKIGGTDAAGQYKDYFNLVEPIQRSKVDTLRYGGGATFVGAGSLIPIAAVTNGNASTVSIPRFTRRIQQSIAMYMPTPLIFNTNNVYEEVSLTALAGKVTIGAASAVAGAALGAWASLSGGLTQAAKAVKSPSGQNILSSAVSGIAKLTSNPINPAVEILFANTPVRQFAFELLLAPRNQKESESIQSIIQTLRFHGAPEINTATAGLTWIPPAEFDITFFNKGVENMKLLRINTCVLERIEVDYAPAGGTFSTFRNGHPVAVRLSLGFRELEPIHKQRILQGF